MTFLLRLLFSTLMATAAATGARAAVALAPVDVANDNRTLPVRVSSSDPELQRLSQQAFESHGRYRLVAANYRYDIVFTAAGPARVRVDVTRGVNGPSVLSTEVPGSADKPEQARRLALLKAADLAVEATNELGLKGFFTARLALIAEMTGKPEIYTTADLFFGDVKKLTTHNNHTLFPRWSPDGQRIVYTSYFKSGAPDIFVYNLATFQVSQLASFKGTNLAGHFSPDGQSLAAVLTGTGTSQIYLLTPTGGLKRDAITQGDTVKSTPVFSPDGRRVLYSADQPGGGGRTSLQIVSIAGGRPQPVSTGYTYNAEPDWSRTHPNRIVFTTRVNGRFQIAVHDLGTGQSRIVTEAGGPYDVEQPAWLPDGRHVVCTLRTARGSQLQILDTETGRMKAISPGSLGAAYQASVLAR